MAERAQQLFRSLSIQRRQRDREKEAQQTEDNEQQFSLLLMHHQRMLKQGPLLPVIHEVDSHDESCNSSCSQVVVVWPSAGQTSWPPSNTNDQGNNNYGSFPTQGYHVEEHPDYISSSSDEDDWQHQLRQPSRKHKYTTPLVAIFSLFLSAIAWLPMLKHHDDNHQFAYDEIDEENSPPPTWFQHSHKFDKMVKKDDSIFGGGISMKDAQSSIIPQGYSTSTTSLTLTPDILYGDLAALVIPPYFQETVDLCISTIHAISSNTTSAMPDEVSKLRKNMLKTRDLFDIFSPVYSKHSSLGAFEQLLDDSSSKHLSWVNGLGVYELTLQQHDGKRHNKKIRKKEEESMNREIDLWLTLRHFLDNGYELIGRFQDLDHAKIKYTSTQLAKYQIQVWRWNEEFLNFVEDNRHHISLYLSLPCKRKHQMHHNCSHSHSHSSHLIWGDAKELPDGNWDSATLVLGKLGAAQLERAEMYLRDALTYDHIIDATSSPEEALVTSDEGHEIYHNLRKELRSFMDELELFGNLLLPDSSLKPEIVSDKNLTDVSSSARSVQEHTEQALYAVKRTRQTLGDLNDDYAKYEQYVEWDEYPEEQLKLKTIIEAQWGYFKIWAKNVNLFARIQFLRDQMAPSDELGNGL